MQISKFCDLGYLTFAYPAPLIKTGGILFRNTVVLLATADRHNATRQFLCAKPPFFLIHS